MPLCFFVDAERSMLGSASHTPFGPKASSSVVPLRIVSLASSCADDPFLSEASGVVDPDRLFHRSVMNLILIDRR